MSWADLNDNTYPETFGSSKFLNPHCGVACVLGSQDDMKWNSALQITAS